MKQINRVNQRVGVIQSTFVGGHEYVFSPKIVKNKAIMMAQARFVW